MYVIFACLVDERNILSSYGSPSRTSRAVRSHVGFVHDMKWSNHPTKMLVCIHSLEWHSCTASGGAPPISSGFRRTRGNISIDGSYRRHSCRSRQLPVFHVLPKTSTPLLSFRAFRLCRMVFPEQLSCPSR